MKRCREGKQNVALKANTVSAGRAIRGVLVLPELWNADVTMAIRRWGILWMIAVEIEFSVRNVIRNIERDLGNGAIAVLIVTPNERMSEAISRKVRRELPPSIRERVKILTHTYDKERI